MSFSSQLRTRVISLLSFIERQSLQDYWSKVHGNSTSYLFTYQKAFFAKKHSSSNFVLWYSFWVIPLRYLFSYVHSQHGKCLRNFLLSLICLCWLMRMFLTYLNCSWIELGFTFLVSFLATAGEVYLLKEELVEAE